MLAFRKCGFRRVYRISEFPKPRIKQLNFLSIDPAPLPLGELVGNVHLKVMDPSILGTVVIAHRLILTG